MKKSLVSVPTIISVLIFVVLVQAETEKECYVKKDEATNVEKWTIDCEEMEEIDRDFLDALTEVTFKNHTVEIKNCTSSEEETYTYTLNSDFVWELRVELYKNYSPKIEECRKNVAVSKLEYYECIREVRNSMKIGVDDMTQKIDLKLKSIKTELEENCNNKVT